MDNGLDIILTAYPMPLFIMGVKRVLGHFKKLTKHAGAVIDYIPGHYDNMPLPELKESVEPFIKNWKKVKQQDLLNQLDNAAGKQKLAVGMKDVWRVAMGRKGRLLLVEKNYRYAAEHGSSDEIIYKATEPYNKFSYIKDAVDDVIEKVLENGGDVEFVDEGLLAGYHHIALIQFINLKTFFMKTILVTTDFSAAAGNAVTYAADLALSINAKLLILSVAELPVSYSDVPIVLGLEDVMRNTENDIKKLKEDVQAKTNGKIEIETEVGMGGFFHELKEVCERVKPYTVVMGSQG
ncbi:MAG: universal stress protein [Chitinophagaceae bacterium]|nr:universal stress protein [Chitinophagaceae bacterium]